MYSMSVSCGIICLGYVLKQFKKESNIESISVRFTSSSENIWITDLGRIAMEYNLASHIYCTSVLLDLSWFQSQSLLKDEIMYHIQTEEGMRRQAYESLLLYLEEGGTLEYEVITRSRLENALSHGVMILACLSSAVIHEEPHHLGGHYVIISNITDKIWILSPNANALMEDTMTEEKFFCALNQWGNWVLLISPKPLCFV